MPRLFTGLEVPARVAGDLASLQGGLPGARWVDPGDFHVTLSFLGDVDRHVAGEVDEMLARLDRPAMTLRIVGLDLFGPKKPTSIFARVAADKRLSELQAAHDGVLRRLGVPVQKRRFTPHVTIARTAKCEPKAIAKFMGQAAGYMSDPFPVSRTVLYSARDSVGGGPYHAERTYPLRGTVGEPEPA